MRRPLSFAIHSAAVAGLLGMVTAPAFADASSDVMNAVVATMNASSYHITVTSPRSGVIEGDIVKPNKMHMTMKDGESIVIGSTMYMKMGGKWTKTTGMAFSMDPSSEVKRMQANRANYSATDLGMRTVGGVPYHAYLVTDNKKHTKDTIYVDSSGRFGRIEASGITMTFTKYGENVAIVPPM